ncbi:MAG: GGDEF domain-containing protein [Tepidisphaeraceae bacterium]
MNQPLLDKILRAPQLPSLPAVAVQVLELAKQSNASISSVARVISSDPALSAKVLKTVNSSFYSLPQQVSTINHALALLGMQTVKTLALGFSLAGSLNSKKSPKFDYVRFWRQSLFSAVAARTVAKTVEAKEPEEAFLAGLLSDIGTLAMHRALGADYDELLSASEGDQVKLVKLSRERFDLDHAQVGGALAEQWKFPAGLVEPIRQHHALTQISREPANLIEIVFVGVLCAQVFSAKRPGLLKKAKQELNCRFNLDDAAVKQILAEVDVQSNELADLFEVAVGPGRTFQDIEQEARQVLEEISLQSQLQTHRVQQQMQELKVEASTDGLTGLANRNRFSQFMAQSLAAATASGQPLSLLFLDLDRFKAINDVHGHQAGDQVLQRTAKVIESMVGQTDLAARYGGEEIAIVLNSKDTKAAARLAEGIRQAIQNERIAFEGKEIAVTASIGVTTSDAKHRFSSPEEMIAAADKAVYSAKSGGRNCIRISSPKLAA